MSHTVEVLGEKVEVNVDRDLRFTAKHEGQNFTAASRAELEEMLRKSVKLHRVEHSIGLVIEHEGHVVRATLRRKHAGRHAYLFTIGDGSAAIESPRVLSRGEHVTDEEIAELNRLMGEARQAETRLLTKRHEIERRAADTLPRGWGNVAGLLLQEANTKT